MKNPLFKQAHAPGLFIQIGDAAPPGEMYSLEGPQNQVNRLMSHWLDWLFLGLIPKNRADRCWRWTADKLPRKLIYWATVRLLAYAAYHGQHRDALPSKITLLDALERWEKR